MRGIQMVCRSAPLCLAVSMTLGGCAGVRESVLGECTGDRTLAVVAVDRSSTQRAAAREAEQLHVVRQVTTETSEDCGHIVVDLFGSAVGDVVKAVDRDVTPAGYSDAERDRGRPKVVAAVVEDVRHAMATPPAGDGSDVVGAIGRAARLLAQGDRTARRLVIVTDGVSEELATPELTAATAADFADRVTTLPDLTGVEVVVTGVGRVAGAPAPTPYVDGLRAYYGELCRRGGATTCAVHDELVAR